MLESQVTHCACSENDGSRQASVIQGADQKDSLMYRLGDDLGFVAHPRTASRYTRDVLEAVGAEKIGGHHNLCESTCKNILQKGGVIVCTVRNMYDVVVSWYYNQHIAPDGSPLKKDEHGEPVLPTFRNWVLDELIPKPRHRWFMTPMFHYALPWCARRLRYETLHEDLTALLSEYGHKMPDVEPVGVSKDKSHFMDYYDQETKQAVGFRWHDDLYLTEYYDGNNRRP